MVYDIAIIGAGVVGSLTARALARYDLKIALVEKTSDVAMGTSKANSGIVHAGFDAKNGTLKAKLNVRGCAMMEEVCSTLFVPYEKNGSLVVAFSDSELDTLKELYQRGINNDVPDMELIDAAKLKELEPNISDEAKGALWAKSAGIVSPYELAIAAAECAAGNGVDFIRNFPVDDIKFDSDVFTLKSEKDDIQARIVINSAGLYAGVLANKFDGEEFEIIPRLGEYGLLDRSCSYLCSHTIFQCPNEMGKGILVTPTCHHNILVGPSAVNMEDKDDTSVRVGALREVFATAQKSVPTVSMREMITSFAGIRSHSTTDDFIIQKSKANDHMINLVGIESPGLASSPAIAEYVKDMVVEILGGEPAPRPNYNPSRSKPIIFRELSIEEKEKVVAENPDYAKIICRCETITEGEIRAAIKAPAGAVDIDGVKRRTRAGMGRCQGGFCGSKVLEILADELDKPLNEIKKFGGESSIIYERTK